MVKQTKRERAGVKRRNAEEARLADDRRRLQRSVRDQKLIVKLSRELKRRIAAADNELLDLARVIADRHEITEPAHLSTEEVHGTDRP